MDKDEAIRAALETAEPGERRARKVADDESGPSAETNSGMWKGGVYRFSQQASDIPGRLLTGTGKVTVGNGFAYWAAYLLSVSETAQERKEAAAQKKKIPASKQNFFLYKVKVGESWRELYSYGLLTEMQLSAAVREHLLKLK
jgi:hypothetical protein